MVWQAKPLSGSTSRSDELLKAVRESLGNVRVASDSIWQKAFDYDDRHLHRLISLEPDEEPNFVDLNNYCLDFEYLPVQPDLFRCLLPLCLSAWRKDLLGETDNYGSFVEHFYSAFPESKTFTQLLSPTETLSVSYFFKQSILDEINSQNALEFCGEESSAYRWFQGLTTYGVVFPDISELWQEWWTIQNAGQAYAAIQYFSCLIYDDDFENPIFRPWTHADGGGAPVLWQRHPKDCWQSENIEFLRQELNIESIGNIIEHALIKLRTAAEFAIAQNVSIDFAKRIGIVRSRCIELPNILEKKYSMELGRSWSQ